MRLNCPLALLLLFSLGCGTTQSRLRYDATAYTHREVSNEHRSELVAQIKRLAQSRRLLHQVGQSRAIRVRPADVSELPLVALAAFAMFADHKFRGAEVDVRVQMRGLEPVPVSVYVGLEGAMRVHTPGGGNQHQAIPVVNINLVDGPVPWDSTSRRAANIAFGLLSAAELTIVQTVPVSRYRNERGREDKGALYVQRGCQAEIRVYNLAFEGDGLLFSGRPERPVPHSSRTMLHEIGHALHNAPALRAACAYLKRASSLSKRIERFNAMVIRANRTRSPQDVSTVRQLRRRIEREQEAVGQAGERAASMAARGPVLSAYERVLDGQPAPTLYGESSVRESFAEAFSLFRADPAALRRVLPKVYSWFVRGGHVRAMTAEGTIGRAYRR